MALEDDPRRAENVELATLEVHRALLNEDGEGDDLRAVGVLQRISLRGRKMRVGEEEYEKEEKSDEDPVGDGHVGAEIVAEILPVGEAHNL